MAIETPTYIEESFGYRIEVRTEFDFTRSNPLQGQYLFQYHITITNVGGEPAQLLTRLWHIEDAEGEVRQVKGPGVIGHTPHFKMKEVFEYSSFCPLPTMSGRMWGHFEMLGSNGKTFEITTPVFRFKIPEDFIDRY
jgi:ApaG protein